MSITEIVVCKTLIGRGNIIADSRQQPTDLFVGAGRDDTAGICFCCDKPVTPLPEKSRKRCANIFYRLSVPIVKSLNIFTFEILFINYINNKSFKINSR